MIYLDKAFCMKEVKKKAKLKRKRKGGIYGNKRTKTKEIYNGI